MTFFYNHNDTMHLQAKHTFHFLIPALIIIFILIPVNSRLSKSQYHNITTLQHREITTSQHHDLNECTTGVASGAATPDGRPLLWKNRDCFSENQEYHYVDNGNIPFIGLTYAGNIVRYYAGVNAAGFAIENSIAHNLTPYWGGDEGLMMKLALEICRTVDDFQELLDTLFQANNDYNSNFGVIDAFGGAAIFEASSRRCTRYDADETEDGFLIRSNFAVSGNQNQIDDETGLHRFEQANNHWKNAVDNGRLTPQFIYQQVIRDLSQPDLVPVSIPFDGYYDDFSYGCLPNDLSICRSSTRSVFLVKGVEDGERPDDTVIWAMVGSPLAGIATPLWVRAGSVPEEYDGHLHSSICDRAAEIKDWIYVSCNWVDVVDTWRLFKWDRTGYWNFSLLLEDYVFDKTEQFLSSPNFSYDQMAEFQNEVAQQVVDSLQAWHPTYETVETLEVIYEDNNIVLIWDEEDNGQHRQVAPRGYTVYRSDYPFRESDRGQRLSFVEDNRFVDMDALKGGAFYRVEAMY
ncbi:MAG: carcinine hydrolase/isopenicillin-N N-acyltransferase family protein [Candidatus Hatepunaea meridiana]|nr:carcinine hydrolase/isopenicillin-N N-acyltransferase family protein [Candidatus Hatepunaea meridiana]